MSDIFGLIALAKANMSDTFGLIALAKANMSDTFGLIALAKANANSNPAKIYGVSWDKGETPDLTRTDDAVGMVANIGIDDEIVTNRFR
jgi:hypothetical protein